MFYDFETRSFESCKQKIFNGKIEWCIARCGFHKFFNISHSISETFLLSRLFYVVLDVYREASKTFYNSFWNGAENEKNEIGREKCFTNWIENLCYEIYFTIFALFLLTRRKTENLAEEIERMLDFL